jgi:ribosomal protein S4
MIITVKSSYLVKPYWKELLPKLEKIIAPSWLNYDHDKHQAQVTTLPDVSEADALFDPTLIIEFYSK